MSSKTNIFTIYAWEDKNVMQQIMHYLEPHEESGKINIWNDAPILPGKDWKPKMNSRIENTDIFILLLSSDFMKSNFIKQIEFKEIIDTYKANKAIVIPVLVDDCEWYIDFKSEEYNFNFNELQVLPEQRNPIENWSLPEEAFDAIGPRITQRISELRGEKIEIKVEKEIKVVTTNSKVEEQLVLGFFDDFEDDNTNSINEEKEKRKEEKRLIAEAEAIRKKLKEQHLKEDAEAESKLLKEQQLQAKEAQRLADAQQLQAELEAKQLAEEEQRLLEEAQRKEIEAQRVQKAALTQQQAEEERKLAEAQQLQAELEAKQLVEEEQRLLEEAKRKEIEAQQVQKAALAQQQAEEERKLAEAQQLRAELEAKQLAEKEQRLLEEAQSKEIEAQRVQKAALAQQQAEEERQLAKELELAKEIEAKEQAEEAQRLLEEAEASKAYQEHDQETIEYNELENEDDEINQVESKSSNKKGLLLLFLAAVASLVYYIFSEFTTNVENQTTIPPENNRVVVEEPQGTDQIEVVPDTESTISSAPEELVTDENKSFSELKIGDTYAGGIVFSIDQASKTGKIAHMKDAGPMPWKNAIKIDEELGEGWHLPTLNELSEMYKSIGPGANNSGNFTEEMYWTSTIYRKIQSRMVRFSDGNTSFHYSNVKASRKFRVRAIKEIRE